ncbi:unannotated protein [freshwater metagenome]|uniref:Unannotated protein n=1 Tax=freshwater metagenome TaxID=449393 RepID=A0A6J6EU31_9ZZZZ
MIHPERHEIALVHPDEVGPHVDRAFEFVLVVDLDQCVQSHRPRDTVEFGQLSRRQRRGDQQHAVGPHQAGVENVENVDREVLAQHRQTTGRRCGLEIPDGSPEEFLVGEHREATGSSVPVLVGQDRGIEADGEVALRRRTTFDLGDHAQTFGRIDLQSRSEAPCRTHGQTPRRQVVTIALVALGTPAVPRDDSVEIRRRSAQDQAPLPPMGVTKINSGRPARKGMIDGPRALKASDPMCTVRAS